MDDLHVDGELMAIVVEDKDTDTATARVEGGRQTLPEIALLGNRKASLDITVLGHSNNAAVLEIQDSVLLEDRAEHSLHDDTRGGVGDGRRLLVQGLGKEVNTKVAVLASSSRGRDSDDLTRSALEHQDVSHADVMARDGDSVGDVRATMGRPTVLSHLADLDPVGVIVVVVEHFVGHLVEAVTE